MYKNSLTMVDNHMGWQQRIKRERGSQKYFVQKQYADDSGTGQMYGSDDDNFEFGSQNKTMSDAGSIFANHKRSVPVGGLKSPGTSYVAKPKQQLMRKQKSLSQAGYTKRTQDLNTTVPRKITFSGGHTTDLYLGGSSQENVIYNQSWLNQPTDSYKMLERAYPVPYQRVNQDQKQVRSAFGYMNDGTATNPSDPNSMSNKGGIRNSVYNIQIMGQPDVKQTVYSGSLDHADPGKQNQTFYSFGAQHTNIRGHFDTPEKSEYAKLLNKHFADIQVNTVLRDSSFEDLAQARAMSSAEQRAVRDKAVNFAMTPNVAMNDYTKNISENIFSPGLCQPEKLKLHSTKYVKTKANRKWHQQLDLHSKYFRKQNDPRLKNIEEDVNGMRGVVEGKLGEKKIVLTEDTQSTRVKGALRAKSVRPRTSAGERPPQSTRALNETIAGMQKGHLFKRLGTKPTPQNPKGSAKQIKIASLHKQISIQKTARRKLEHDVASMRSTIYQLSEHLGRVQSQHSQQ